jgi:hypothetical protein
MVAVTDYQACRDRAEGTSTCSIDPLFTTLTQISVYIAPLSFVLAAAIMAIPFIGKVLAAVPSGPLKIGLANCAIAVALLLAFLSTLFVYASCRDGGVPSEIGIGANVGNPSLVARQSNMSQAAS